MAALTPTHRYANGTITTSNATGGDTGDTIALTGARPGVCQRIKSIAVYAAGTVTVVSPTVTLADGSTIIAKLGGATTATPFVWNFHAPINCTANNNAVVHAILTGGTAGSVHIAVNYELGNAS